MSGKTPQIAAAFEAQVESQSDCGRCTLILTTAKEIITDLLGELLKRDARAAVTWSRRIERRCPWFRGM